ncbi:MAG: hypothetical protein BroJett011_47150 [Chloroflexota bacterium]|nr:MAG: hypothetical protein BroJett011_47150 [Chloroflexota bacterium]
MIYPFMAKPKPGRLTAKMNLILGVLTLIIAAMATSTAAVNPAYQSAGEWRSYPTPAQVMTLAVEGDFVYPQGRFAGLERTIPYLIRLTKNTAWCTISS